jgi:hypothetical protein
MNKDAEFIMAMSCALPALVGAVRYKNIDRRFHSFIYMLLLVPVVEIIEYVSLKTNSFQRFSGLWINIYLLINFGFFLSFVHRNGYISKKLMRYFALAFLATALINWAIKGSPLAVFYYLLCFASCLILLICIDILSKQMMAVNASLLKNSWFWISSIYVIQHAYSLLFFSIYIFNFSETANGKAIIGIYKFVNMGCYLLFIIAVLLIPKRKKTSLHQPS